MYSLNASRCLRRLELRSDPHLSFGEGLALLNRPGELADVGLDRGFHETAELGRFVMVHVEPTLVITHLERSNRMSLRQVAKGGAVFDHPFQA